MLETSSILRRWLAISAIIVGLGLSGNALANGCVSIDATFTSSVGSTTSCSGFTGTGGAAMGGIVLGSGDTTGTYIGDCAFRVDVPDGVGQSTGGETRFEIHEVPGYDLCQVKTSIFQGNQGANYCVGFYRAGTSGDTMTTLGNKLQPVPHKQAEFCTDEVADTVSPPVISLEKKVVKVEYDTSGGTPIQVIDCSAAVDQLDVIANADPNELTEVAYCFTIRNDGVGTALDVTLSDPTVFSSPLSLGSLPPGPGQELKVEEVVAITDASEVGEIVNTALVTSTFDGSTCLTCSDEDTATVNVVVECDAATQAQANITGAVVETRTAQGISRCAPKGDLGNNETDSVALLCDGSCELRDECGGVTGKASDCAQPCKPSFNWTYGQNDTTTGGISSGSCVSGTPSPGNLPLCQEVLGNPSNTVASCEANDQPTLIRSDGHSITFGSNPILYYFPPGSLGGNSVGVTYCILEPGDTAADCPPGSWVY